MQTREEWLHALASQIAPMLSIAVPVIRLSVGFPAHRRGGKRIGECWSPDAATDHSTAIFISPTIADAQVAAGVLVHEMVHAAVGVKAGHRGAFRRMALRVGLTGKMTSTQAGPELSDKLAELIDEIGPYPHAALNADLSGRKKQSTRMLKVTCQACGCIVRMTAKWIEDVGAPTCACGTLMESV